MVGFSLLQKIASRLSPDFGTLKVMLIEVLGAGELQEPELLST